jgi:hypothetical protein
MERVGSRLHDDAWVNRFVRREPPTPLLGLRDKLARLTPQPAPLDVQVVESLVVATSTGT